LSESFKTLQPRTGGRIERYERQTRLSDVGLEQSEVERYWKRKWMKTSVTGTRLVALAQQKGPGQTKWNFFFRYEPEFYATATTEGIMFTFGGAISFPAAK
jgi:hypothetical protein